MTVFGGRSRRNLRGVSLVVQNEAAFSTEWILRQVLAGVDAAQGHSCKLQVFILEDDLDMDFAYLSNTIPIHKLSSDAQVWIPEVLETGSDSDAVVVVGIKANKDFSVALRSSLIYLPILLDKVEEPPLFFPDSKDFLDVVAKKANTVFFNSEMSRSNAETVAPSLCERTRVFGPSGGGPSKRFEPDNSSSKSRLVQPVSGLTDNIDRFFERLADEYREHRQPPRTDILGTPEEEKRFKSGDLGHTSFLAGVEFHNQLVGLSHGQPTVTIIDDLEDCHHKSWRLQQALDSGLTPLALSKVELKRLVDVLTLGSSIPAEWVIPQSSLPRSSNLSTGIREELEPNQLSSDSITRVVLAGRDFKFASSIVRELESASDIEFVLDHSKAGRKQSAALTKWADVVLTEFLTPHAVWYSNNLPTGTRLIIHMHGYELYKPLVHDLNINGVYRVVVPSEGYRQRVLEKMRWPENMVQVIHNGGLTHDLIREKEPQAKYTLGLVGWVPSLKRIDRALDLLQRLICEDPRYMLEVRGAMPWNYKWEWEKPAHRDMYFETLVRLRENPTLASHVTFAPFGPDVGNWLRGIGWMLSPSVRESFHLAPVEGMISGAVPVVWQREGASDVYGEQWLHTDTEEAADYILKTNSSEFGWGTRSQEAKADGLQHYDEAILRAEWHALIVTDEVEEEPNRTAVDSQRRPYTVAEKKALEGDFLGAWDEIQRNGNELVHTSKRRGLEFSAWVEGHIRLPRLLLSTHYELNQIDRTSSDTGDRFVHVAIASIGRNTREDTYGSAGFALLVPPAGSHESADYISGYFSAFEPLVPVIGDTPLDPLPLNKYIEDASSKLIEQANVCGATDFLVDGPYWAVLVALRAAMATGGQVQWDLSQNMPGNLVSFRSFVNDITDDPLDFVSRLIADHVSNLIVDLTDNIPLPIMEMFSSSKIKTTHHSEVALPVPAPRSARSMRQSSELTTISVVVTSYKIDNSLFATLTSLQAQSYPKPRVEVMVMLLGQDAGSSHDLERHMSENFGTSWEVLEVKAGIAIARNLSVGYASGESLVFVQAGDVLEPHSLASMAAVSGPRTLVVGEVRDLVPSGGSTVNLDSVQEMATLGFGRHDFCDKRDLFCSLEAKLIPKRYIRNRVLDNSLVDVSGEAFFDLDIVEEDLHVVASHRMGRSMYLRRV